MNQGQSAPVALVTGVGRTEGIGFAVCQLLAQRGLTVLLTARDEAKAAGVAQPLADAGLDVRPYALDITDDASVAQLADAIDRTFGRLDVLVNNAAVMAPWGELPSSADLGSVQQTLAANLLGPWRVTQALLPLIRRSPRGRIVNVSSGAGSHDDPQFGLTTGGGSVASYGVSKAALNALTAKFAAELAGSGILVNAVCPGFTATAPGMEAMGARPAAESAAGIVWAALLPDGGPSGGFFRDGQPLPW
ncbi:MAG TPA: SDR family NAD(P)-dependent oxidoreductase [Roseiflexaceae bacterium]|nr:SDR family NAD(P)-dependent oxidoreductase [Roseiflexaceae bacterium]